MFCPNYANFFLENKNLLCIADKQGRLVTVNNTFTATFGQGGSVAGSFFTDLVLDDETQKTYKIFENLTSELNSGSQVLKMKTNNAGIICVQWSATEDIETGYLYFTGTDVTKHHETQELLSNALDLSQVGGWEVNLLTGNVASTKAVLDIYELPNDQALSLDGRLDFFHPDDRPILEAAMQNAIANQQPYNLELRFLSAKGNEIWVSCIGRPILRNGKVIKLQGTFQDITSRKNTEFLLQSRETHLKAITDFTPLGILVTDVSGKCTYANTAFSQISGLSLENALDFGWHSVVHAEDKALLLANWQTQASPSEKTNVRVRFNPLGSNEQKWVGCVAAPFYNNNRLQGYVAILEDVTEKYYAEEKIRESEHQLKEAQRMANLSSWEYNFNKEKLTWSEEAFTLLGLDPNTGVPVKDEYMKMIHPDDVEILLYSVENALKGGIPYEIEIRTIAPNGEIRYTKTKGIPVHEQGKLIKLSGVSLDITEQKQTEKELIAAKEKAEEAMRAKAQFLSIMSHEIRTPLNAIIGITYLMLHEEPKPEQLENLRTLRFSAENLLALINDILDFSKIEAGKVVFEEINFNLLEAVNGIKHSLSFLAEEKGINLKFRRDEELPEIVVGDPVRLSQILVNLVSNAIKFTNQGSVTIDALVTAETESTIAIEFSITDTGIGIDEESLEHIFDSFTQESTDTTRRFGGTGLGLAIIKRLLELQDSKINVESEKGKGSRFYFTLTFKKPDAQKPKYISYKSDLQSFTSLGYINVLLAEDNQVNQLVVSKFLHKWDVRVEVAENGRIAVEKAKANKYDLILMDLHMPELDGFGATKQIREICGDHPAIIALTASATPDVMDKILAVGMNDCVIKPFNPQELYNKIVKFTQVPKHALAQLNIL